MRAFGATACTMGRPGLPASPEVFAQLHAPTAPGHLSDEPSSCQATQTDQLCEMHCICVNAGNASAVVKQPFTSPVRGTRLRIARRPGLPRHAYPSQPKRW